MLKGVIPAVDSAGLIKSIRDTADERVMFLSGRLTTQHLFGADNEGLISLSEYAQYFRDVQIATDAPLIADGQSGFGNPLSMWNAAEEIGRSGAKYLLINDQPWPSHSAVPAGADDLPTLLGKIKAAQDGSEDSGMEVIVKLEGVQTYGLKGLIKRIKLAVKAGIHQVAVSRLNPEQLDQLAADEVFSKVGIMQDDDQLTLAKIKSVHPAFIIPVNETLKELETYRKHIIAVEQ